MNFISCPQPLLVCWCPYTFLTLPPPLPLHFFPSHKSLCLSCCPRSKGSILKFSKLMKLWREGLNTVWSSCQALQTHLSASTFSSPKRLPQMRPTSIWVTLLCTLLEKPSQDIFS